MVAMLKQPAFEYLSEEGVVDRRMFQRKPTSGAAQGRRIDHTLSARQNPRLRLDLRDLSVGGLSAIADYPLERGERLGVFVESRGLKRGWDAFGHVVRCEASATGYRIAIEFDSLPAA
ncbi:MAG TPA: PilZ domain-containing protein [Tepidisphaeraceae bacterium]|nr:PilZ domain-containing protein [Tepidisphaeraceae bacterium]